MSKSVGIDAGEFAVKVVELEGSYKKARLGSYHIARVVATVGEGADRAKATAAAVAQCLQEGKVAGDQVLGHPCREAVLRTIEVPFRGADAIRKVIKSEVESAIHSHAVDDMVVDFHEIGGGGEGSRVLVAAVPKPGLAAALDALAAEGIEPERVDLDTMALYRVADWCGAFELESNAEVAAVADGEARPSLPAVAPAAVAPGTLTAILELGARSTRVLLVDGARLVDMRTLRLGDASIVDAVSRSQQLTFDQAHDVVRECLVTGIDGQAQVMAEVPATTGEGAAAAPAATRSVVIAAADVDRERAAFVQRLSRELLRFLASTTAPGTVKTLWLTGGASQVRGVHEAVREVFGVEPRHLDVLGRLKHTLTPEEAEDIGPRLAVAIGLALANFGGPVGYDFRRENLAFTRGFDRIKSSLAIACALAVFATLVWAARLNSELKNVEYRIGMTYAGSKPGETTFFGELNHVAQLFKTDDFRHEDANKKPYGHKQLVADLVNLPVKDRIKFVHDKVQRALTQKQKESGIYEEVALESGLAVLVRFFEVLQQAESRLGRYVMGSFELNMRGTGGQKFSGRFVHCRIAFHGDGFVVRYADLCQAFAEECKRPGSPFEAVDEKVGKGEPFKEGPDGRETGAWFDFKIHVREGFPSFGVEK